MPPQTKGKSTLKQAMELSAAIRLRVERPENGDSINAMIREANRREAAVLIVAGGEAGDSSESWSENRRATYAVSMADVLLAGLGRGGGT